MGRVNFLKEMNRQRKGEGICFALIESDVQASLWCRVSAQVYNVKEDYMQLAEAVLKLKEECVNGYCPDVEKASEPNRWSWSEEPH